MPQKKKLAGRAGSTNKITVSNRGCSIQSALSKSKSKKKSSNNTNAMQAEHLYQHSSTQMKGSAKKGSRLMVISPEKIQAQQKPECSVSQQAEFKSIGSPVNKQKQLTPLVTKGLDGSFQQKKESSQFQIDYTQKPISRPLTSAHDKQTKAANLKQSVPHDTCGSLKGNKKPLKLGFGQAVKRMQVPDKASIAVQGYSSTLQPSQQQNVHSPRVQPNPNPQTSNQNIWGSSSQQPKLDHKSHHGPDPLTVTNSLPSGSTQSQNPKPLQTFQGPQPLQLFQHIIASNIYKQHQVSLEQQNSLNGLLNMNKQRGLINNQLYSNQNIRNPTNNSRSVTQHHQKPRQHYPPGNSLIALQTSGSFASQKAPLYNSINFTQQQQQQSCPLSIYEMQFQQSKGMMRIHNIPFALDQGEPPYQANNNALKGNLQHQLAQYQQQSLHTNFSIQPVNKQKDASNTLQHLQGTQAKRHQVISGKRGQVNQYQQPEAVALFTPQCDQFQKRYPSPLKQSISALGSSKCNRHSIDQDINQMLQSCNSKALEVQHIPGELVEYNEQVKQQLLQQLLENQLLPGQALPQQPPMAAKEHLLSKLQADYQIVQTSKAQPVKKASKVPFSNAYVEDRYKYIVVQGNNSGLINKAMERRDWWIEIPQVHSMFNFKWQPVSQGIKYERLSPMKAKPGEIGGNFPQFTSQPSGVPNSLSAGQLDSIATRQMVNHFENHHLISEKANLFNNLQKFCDSSKENIFDLTPITFYVEITDLDKSAAYYQSMMPFTQFHQCLEENKTKVSQLKEQLLELQLKQEEEVLDSEEKPLDPLKDLMTQINPKSQNNQQKVTKFKAFTFDKRSTTNYSFPLSHFDGYNLWLLKPTHLNRGRGIHVFRDLGTLHRLIKDYCAGKDEELKTNKKDCAKEEPTELQPPGQIEDPQEQQSSPNTNKSKVSPKKNAYKIKHNTFIIQKYIERPLLVFNRKFDIRQWVLVTQDYDVYFFKEGYLRTTSCEYSIDLENVDNQYVHLTNNAVQKFSETYGEFEDGNQLSYQRFQQVLEMQYPDSGINVYEHLVPQMKEQIVKNLYSIRKKLDPFKRKFCFEPFGYDFILDEDFNIWLIEVNTNPCLEESSQLLKTMLPRMVEDMLKLTVDQIFPKIKKKKSKQKKMGCPPKNSKVARTGSLLDKIDEMPESNVNTQDTQEDQQVQNPESEASQKQTKQPIKSSTDETKSTDKSRIHPVPGYSDTENMWEKIWNLEKQEAPSNKYPNDKSEYLIHIKDKQFKLKKNPLFKSKHKEQAQSASDNGKESSESKATNRGQHKEDQV